MRALIVDDHPLMREAVCSLLAHLHPGVEQLSVGRVADALQVLDTAPLPDVAVLDLCLPDGDSEPVVRRLRAAGGPGPRIFVLSASADADDARRMLRAGANGYCPKSESPQTLAAALQLVLDGHRYVPPLLLDWGDEPVTPEVPGRLTQRQREVLELLARGLPNKTIGRELGIAERTVKLHVQGLFALLGATNRTHAVARAREVGLLGSSAAHA
ncbi:MAG: response regulator transcription factor [Burkholderiales bacterium]|nr:response regulator transcription factor [Burkholderiales bacterium]